MSVFSFEGGLDSWTTGSPSWCSAAAEVEACAETAVPDLRRLYFMDLVSPASIEELARTLKARGRRLILAGARPRAREFLGNASVSIAAGRLWAEDALASIATSAVPIATAA